MGAECIVCIGAETRANGNGNMERFFEAPSQSLSKTGSVWFAGKCKVGESVSIPSTSYLLLHRFVLIIQKKLIPNAINIIQLHLSQQQYRQLICPGTSVYISPSGEKEL